MDAVRLAVVEKLLLHPRVKQQDLAADRNERMHMGTTLPALVPFKGRALFDVVAVLDWDHRLPSRALTLRLHAFYAAEGRARFDAALAERLATVKEKDLFPEFDVPDLAGLPGDEVYDAEVTLDYTVEAMRLVSPWRRELDPAVAERAAAAVRASAAFADVKAAEAQRPAHLGDLEAVSWTPPCESGHKGWTIDVWWITSFDGRTGRGWSFLVDGEGDGASIVAHREFTVRTG